MSDITTLMMAAAGGAAAEETDENFNQTVLLLHGDGTNGAQNNTFLDSSTNNFTITRAGNTTQGTFSPFSVAEGQWSNYFDGTSDYVETPSSSSFAFGTGAFTVEGFFYANRFPTSGNIFQILNFTDDAENISLTANGTISYWNGSVGTNSTATYSLGTWHHVALVRESTSSNAVKVYLDGVLIITATSSTNYSSNRALVIGARAAATKGANCLDGYMSNVRVAKSAIYTGAFSEITEPLTTTSQSATNVELLTCQSNRFVDNSTNNFAITRSGDVKVTPFSPFAPTAAYDPSVNSGSGYFDGSGDSISITDVSSLLDFGTGAFTISLWFYKPDATNDCAIIDARQTGANSGWFLAINNTNNLRFSYQTGGVDVIGSSTIKAGQWYFVHVSRSGTTVSLYLNGVSDGSGTDNGNFNCDGIVFGAKRYTSSGFNAFPGYLSSINIVSGTATSNAVPSAPTTGGTFLCNFTNAGIFDNTGKNNLETVGNAQIDTTTKKYGSGSMEFDGTGDWLVLPSNNDFNFGSGNWTIEAWVYFTGTPGSSDSSYAIASKWDGSATNEKSFLLRLTSSTGTKAQILCSADGSTNLIATGSTSLSSGTWYHIAAVQNAGTVTLYVNGTSDATVAVSSVHTNNQRVYVGATLSAAGSPVQPLTGLIDDLRITKGVARYTTTFTPPTKAFPDL